MRRHLYYSWSKIFGKSAFRTLNETLLHLGLRGLGGLNFENSEVSGEAWLVQRFLKSRLRDIARPVLFDVGANVGIYTTALFKCFPSARIHSFEAHPATFKRLAAAVKDLPVDTVHAAVGAECGSVTLFDHAKNPTGSEHATIIPSALERIHGSEVVSSLVPCITIDSYCKSRQVNAIDFIKLDIEGNEYAGLLGAADTLRRRQIGIIQFEFNQMNLLAKVTMEDFFNLLEGYTLFRLLPSGLLELQRNDIFQANLFVFQNIIAIPVNSGALDS